VHGSQLSFTVTKQGNDLGMFSLAITGEHNALNALACIIVCLRVSLSVEQIQKGLLAFRGSKRRLEFIGTLQSGAKVYDDYAHHPTEIKTTLRALRQQYPNKKILCVFQPHTYSRTKMLFDEFQKVFSDNNTVSVIITDIFASAREPLDTSISSEKLVSFIKSKSVQQDVILLKKLDDVVQYINEKQFKEDTVIVTMGAGDVYTIHTLLPF